MFNPLDWPGFADVSMAALLFLCAAAFAAGAVDAIVGGGGLIQLPALLLIMPGGDTLLSLATSKVAAFAGTASAVPTYARRTRIDWWTAVPMASIAFGGAVGGAAFANLLPGQVLNGVVLFALVAVGIYTWRKPSLGSVETPRFGRRVQILLAGLGGMTIGFWDGLAGPGTGSFLVFLLVGLLGFAFLHASATAKLVNTATNLGALCYFIPAGKVLWGLGLVMAVCNIAGSVSGALLATSRGSTFVRKVFLSVVAAMALTLGARLFFGT
ncbi:sulfite exporter TauE/SafE family protein [Actinoalloteichus sp. GBA129-24]|uniref:sulfite exporter TauE/SafE family protein n=1 Tax=Actinoalloteichus sp. GBA129-24 TaxID=1612551 RepID=UPI00095047C5|nr:TSUP family transporter [Actinoalloteichus sp. GBA129-24]APU19673.1 putative permease [Actinoalloteichus sp. GBA129-24]